MKWGGTFAPTTGPSEEGTTILIINPMPINRHTPHQKDSLPRMDAHKSRGVLFICPSVGWSCTPLPYGVQNRSGVHNLSFKINILGLMFPLFPIFDTILRLVSVK